MISKTATMIIDVHAHITSLSDKKEMLKTVHQYKIDRVYLSDVSDGGYYPTEVQIAFCNKVTSDFCKEHSDIFRYMCYVNPCHQNAAEVIRRAVEDDHAKGIKLWVATKCNSPFVDAVMEEAIRYRIPVLIHTFHKHDGTQLADESTGYDVAALARRYPEVSLIMAHLGGDAYHGVKPIRDLKNVWTDISGTIYRNGELEYTVQILGEDRVLFGTDAQGAPYPLNIGIVQEAGITEQTREKIFYKNALAVFGGEEK